MKTLQTVKLPLIAILRGITSDEVLDHSSVLIAEGFEIIEVPANSPDWQHSVNKLHTQFGSQIIVGAGTIIEPRQYQQLRATGASLMVTPNFNIDIVQQAKQDQLLICAGVLTPSEVIAAAALQVDIIKLFPAGSMGPDYCKAVLSVAPKKCRYYCVGGITPDNLSDYLALGFSGAGTGGELYRAGQTVATTQKKARQFVAAYRQYQS